MPDTTDAPPDLVSSTGINDQNSPWASLLQTGVDIGSTALKAALAGQTSPGASSGNGTPAQPPGQAPAVGSVALSPGPMSHNYTLWLIGGLIALVLYWFVFGKK